MCSLRTLIASCLSTTKLCLTSCPESIVRSSTLNTLLGNRSNVRSHDLILLEGSAVCDMLPDKKGGVKQARHYERENSIVAHVINNLTCSMRFEGDLNVDLNEITMNMVPFPRMHFLLSSLSPLYSVLSPGHAYQPRGIDDSFREAMEKPNQLIQQANPMEALYLACGLIVRGDKVQVSDITRNVEKLQKRLRMASWNMEGFKVGHCNRPPLQQPYSLLALSNNTCTRSIMQRLRSRFMKIYKQKVFVHHYLEFMEQSHFDHCL